MTFPAIDTYKIVKNLQTAGSDESVAAVLSDTFRESRELDVQNLASKQDFALVRSEIKQESALIRSEFKAEIAEVRSEMMEMKQELKADIAVLDTRVTRLEATMKEGFALAETNNAKSKVEIIRWNVGMMIAMMGFMFAIMRYFAK